MLFQEFGEKGMPVILLLHGGGLSWWTWKKQIDALKEKYHVIAPIIEGHGDDFGTRFIGIEDSAGKIIRYIRDNLGGRVSAICGLSLGAQITVEILSRDETIAEYAVIESALVCPIKNTLRVSLPLFSLFYGLISMKWYSRLQAKAMKLPDEMFPDYFRDSSRITKETLLGMTKSNGYYRMPETLKNTKAKALILVGGKELSVMKKSARLLHETMRDSTLRILKGLNHGEISLSMPERYLEMLNKHLGVTSHAVNGTEKQKHGIDLKGEAL